MFKLFNNLILLLLISLPVSLFAEPNYNTGSSHFQLPPPTAQEIKKGKKAIRIPSNIEVPPVWQRLLNRTYVEYWREGNHLPDAGFILFARNPSLKTAKLWLLRMESKARNLEELLKYVTKAQVELVQKGLIKDRYKMVANNLGRSYPTKLTKEIQTKKHNPKNLKELKFYFLFSPQCPYCRKMVMALQALPNVVPLQVTEGKLIHWEGLPKSERATKETKRAYLINNQVPLLVVYHTKSKKFMRLQGNQNLEAILEASSTVIQEVNKDN